MSPILIAVTVGIAALGAFAYRVAAIQEAGGAADMTAQDTEGTRVTLVEIGSTTCVPCKMMKPVLDALEADYPEQLRIVFVDVALQREQALSFGIRMIPTQVFLDPDGNEIFRHENFFAKEDIETKWAELGYPLTPTGERTTVAATGMKDRIFAWVGRSLEGTWAIAVGMAFVWGILSILLSPCHLASIPLIVGFIDEQGDITTKRACLISSLFSFGILITIAVLGVAAAMAGQLMGDVGFWGNIVIAAVFLLVGLHLLEVVPAPWQGPGQVGMKRRGMLAAFLLGLVFGVALGPCTFAYMGPILAFTFQMGAADLWYGILLMVVYGIGHCGVIALAGTFTEVVQHYMHWNERSRGAVILKYVCGSLVIVAGLYMILDA